MTYKGYISRVEFDERDNILVGKLLGIRDSVSFHADNLTDLRGAFEEAVDDYLETCAKLSKAAEKPASVKLILCVAPDIHSAALIAAQASGLSLNKWAADALARAAHE